MVHQQDSGHPDIGHLIKVRVLGCGGFDSPVMRNVKILRPFF